jgi:hypothetical protein
VSSSFLSVAAVVVSAVVLVVQYMQWRTANQKVVVDLYERRLKVYEQLSKAIGPVLREGEVNGEALRDFMVGEADAKFLFGEEVIAYLENLRRSFAWMSSFSNKVIDQASNRGDLIDIKYKHLREITAFYEVAPDIFAPYMKLTQKNTPFWRPW